MLENFVKIPISLVLETDDLGWDNGEDLRMRGQASRTGMPRRHCLDDYTVLCRLAETTGKNIAAAIVVGDWDKDNILRGEVGFTHNPYGWDRASEINIAATREMIDLIESSGIDYMIHGLLHGRYDESGNRINEKEYLLVKDVDGKPVGYLPSVEDFEHRLDTFFKIVDSWGMKKKFTGFVNPGYISYAGDDLVKEMTRVLYRYGVRYWADPFLAWAPEDGPIKVYNGVACFRWKMGPTRLPWQAYDINPDTIATVNGADDTKKSCILGSHWPNFLRYNSKDNFDYLPAWERFYTRQGNVFGSMNGDSLADAVNQTFYHQFASLTFKDKSIEVDLTKLEGVKLDSHKNEFYISVKHGIAPTKCDGGTISLYDTHDGFDNYKICHTGTRVEIFID